MRYVPDPPRLADPLWGVQLYHLRKLHENMEGNVEVHDWESDMRAVQETNEPSPLPGITGAHRQSNEECG